MWLSILVLREKAGLFIGCISMLIDLYCLLSVGLLSCCSMVIEFPLSVKGKQYLGEGSISECHKVSPTVPLYFCSLSCLLPAFWFVVPRPSLRSNPASLRSLQGLLRDIAYVYFKNASQAFYVNCPFPARSFQTFSLYLFLSLSSPSQLVRELLHEGQAISVGVSAQSGQGGQWLAHIRQLIKEGSVPDVSLVPVGISYDCVPETNIQVDVCQHTPIRTHT